MMRTIWPVACFLSTLLGTSVIAQVASLEIGGMRISPGRTQLQLEVPGGATDPATFIPVTVLRGSSPGPVLLAVSGVHGYEYAPILAAIRLVSDIDPDTLRGTLILVHPANVAAFEARSPYVNPYDRKNLNRSFPGTPDGTQTERIAYTLSTELIAKADFVADLHSGDGAEWLTAFVGVYGGPLATDYELALAFAQATGFPNIVRYQMLTQEQVDRGRSLNRQAVAQGLPTVLIEIGENGKREPSDIEAIVQGLKSGMVVLGMLPETDAVVPQVERYLDGTTSVPVSHSGLWYPNRTGGQDVEQGEELGVIKDYFGTIVETVVAPVSGYGIYGLAGPPVRAGESVMTIGIPVEQLR
ncbi:MAG: M14 family metallopeptidase [Pseudomonadota bacterium]